jgi:hypothetical protein
VFEDVVPQLRRLPRGAVPSMISHRWLTRTDPDPNREQYAVIVNQARDDDFFWYDYSCMPQSGLCRDIQEVLDTLHIQVKASRFIILRNIDDDYYLRGWCYHEWFTAQYMGSVERLMPSYGQSRSYEMLIMQQQVDAKRVADQLIWLWLLYTGLTNRISECMMTDFSRRDPCPMRLGVV